AAALLQCARGLGGEGHRHDVLRADAALLNQVSDLAGDHAGLAGTGAGEHQHGAADIVHGFLLPGVESGHGRFERCLRAGREFSRLGRLIRTMEPVGWTSLFTSTTTTARWIDEA